MCSGGIFSPLSLSWCYTELGQGGLQFTAIPITPLSLSWCYTEFGQGRGTLRSNPLSLSWCYTEFGQGRKFQKQSPVPFLVLHRVRGLGDDHRRGGRFIALRVLGFGFRARVKGLGSSV